MAFALALALGISPVSAAAWPGDLQPHQIVSKCVGKNNYTGQPTIAWRGGDPGVQMGAMDPNVVDPHGKMYLCYYTYRLGDKGPDGDWYGVRLFTYWDAADVALSDARAEARQTLQSTKGPIDGIFGWTASSTSTYDCTIPFNVGIAGGAYGVSIGISTTMQFCKNVTVSLIASTGTDASWKTTKAGKLTQIETVYYEMVAHGTVPTFWINFRVPYYTYQYSAGSDTWNIAEAWTYYGYYATGTI
jgi:hypothetical protein